MSHTLKMKHILAIFVPAILLVSIALFIRIVQYEPLFPKIDKTDQENQEGIQIPIFPDDPILGNKKAPITLIAFEDFGCEACREQMDVWQRLMQKHPNRIKIIWKGLPVTQFPHATEAAQRYGYCAHKQKKFEAFASYAFANFSNLSVATLDVIAGELDLDVEKLETCVQGELAYSYITRVEQIARLLQVQSVPTTFLNGKQIENPKVLEGWETALGLLE